MDWQIIKNGRLKSTIFIEGKWQAIVRGVKDEVEFFIEMIQKVTPVFIYSKANGVSIGVHLKLSQRI